jgi:hypothetical protein
MQTMTLYTCDYCGNSSENKKIIEECEKACQTSSCEHECKVFKVRLLAVETRCATCDEWLSSYFLQNLSYLLTSEDEKKLLTCIEDIINDYSIKPDQVLF